MRVILSATEHTELRTTEDTETTEESSVYAALPVSSVNSVA
jgi:hypothetical protein